MPLTPLQPSDAVQLVAFVEPQVSEVVPPFGMLVGLEVKVTVGAEAIDTVTLWLALPPAPEQASVKVLAVVIGAVASVPDVARGPVQPPEAVQPVAFAELHVSVEVAPLATLVGFALSVKIGSGATVTETLFAAVPPTPLQVKVNVVEAASGDVDCEPDSALAPVQPPEAVQLVAFVELHVNVEAPPFATVPGFEVSDKVGGGGAVPAVTVTLCDAVPPAPVQLNVKVVVVASGAEDSLPLSALAPLQPFEAVQLVAFVEFQFNAVELPTMTDVGLADNATVGAGGPAVTVTAAVRVTLPAGLEQLKV